MYIPKSLYKRFSSHKLAQFFLYLLFNSDENGLAKTTIRKMAIDNEISIRRVMKTIGALKALGAIEIKTEQKQNMSGTVIGICNYDFYEKTQDVSKTENKQYKNLKGNSARRKPFDYSFVEPNLQEPFEEWLKYKRAKKQMYKTQDSLQACYNNLKKFSSGNTEMAIEIVNQSKANNWDGLFELKGNEKRNSNFRASAADKAASRAALESLADAILDEH